MLCYPWLCSRSHPPTPWPSDVPIEDHNFYWGLALFFSSLGPQGCFRFHTIKGFLDKSCSFFSNASISKISRLLVYLILLACARNHTKFFDRNGSWTPCFSLFPCSVSTPSPPPWAPPSQSVAISLRIYGTIGQKSTFFIWSLPKITLFKCVLLDLCSMSCNISSSMISLSFNTAKLYFYTLFPFNSACILAHSFLRYVFVIPLPKAVNNSQYTVMFLSYSAIPKKLQVKSTYSSSQVTRGNSFSCCSSQN